MTQTIEGMFKSAELAAALFLFTAPHQFVLLAVSDSKNFVRILNARVREAIRRNRPTQQAAKDG